MSCTIESARYANAENTSVILVTAEAGLVLISAVDAVEDWEALLATGVTIAAYVEPAPTSYRLYKSVFINRLTNGEAEAMETVLAAAEAKLRLMFNSVEYFESDDPLFATLLQTVGAALGGHRAAELLGPA